MDIDQRDMDPQKYESEQHSGVYQTENLNAMAIKHSGSPKSNDVTCSLVLIALDLCFYIFSGIIYFLTSNYEFLYLLAFILVQFLVSTLCFHNRIVRKAEVFDSQAFVIFSLYKVVV